MIITEQKTENIDFRKVEPGNYLGRLFSIVDLGTQTTEWEGVAKQQRKVMVTFELHGDDKNGPLEIDGKPLVINKRYTLSLGEKATLRADLEAWRGKKLTDEELKAFDLTKLLDKWAMVNVIHNEYKGKTYPNISGLSQVPSQIKEFPKGVNECLMFDLTKYPTNFDKVWPWAQDIIKKSAEWEHSQSKPVNTIVDDDIPF